MILHGLRIVSRIIENDAGMVDDRDARAAPRDPLGPRAKLRRVIEVRRTSLRDIRKRGKLVVGRADVIAPEDAGGVKVYGEQNSEK